MFGEVRIKIVQGFPAVEVITEADLLLTQF